MPVISCFSSPKRLPGTKKEFPNVSARVNSFNKRQNGANADGNPSRIKAKVNLPSGESSAKVTNQPKPRTHHDSAAVSACLKGPTLEPNSKIPARKAVVTCRKAAPATAAPEWNKSTRVDNKVEVKPLPGTRKTLADFVRKPFRAAPVPASTYKPPKDLPAGKKGLLPPVKKPTVKMTSEPAVPFKAKPVPASTYKPFQPKVTKTRQPVTDNKMSDDASGVDPVETRSST